MTTPRTLWLSWTGANAAGEMLGLGAVGAGVAALVAAGASAPPLAVAGAMIGLGAIEGVVVGSAQWLVLRRALPRLRPRAWIGATVAGALLAWMLGMLPSTIISLTTPEASDAPPDMSDGAQLVLAAALGLIGGPILALFQWRVLRRHCRDAWTWIPANGAAWMLGMPVIFMIAGQVPERGAGAGFALTALLLLAAAGAVVGAIHGAVLVSLLRRRR